MTDVLDPVLDATFKGFPHAATPMPRSQVGAQGWNVLAGDLPLPPRDLFLNLPWMTAMPSLTTMQACFGGGSWRP